MRPSFRDESSEPSTDRVELVNNKAVAEILNGSAPRAEDEGLALHTRDFELVEEWELSALMAGNPGRAPRAPEPRFVLDTSQLELLDETDLGDVAPAVVAQPRGTVIYEAKAAARPTAALDEALRSPLPPVAHAPRAAEPAPRLTRSKAPFNFALATLGAFALGTVVVFALLHTMGPVQPRVVAVAQPAIAPTAAPTPAQPSVAQIAPPIVASAAMAIAPTAVPVAIAPVTAPAQAPAPQKHVVAPSPRHHAASHRVHAKAPRRLASASHHATAKAPAKPAAAPTSAPAPRKMAVPAGSDWVESFSD